MIRASHSLIVVLSVLASSLTGCDAFSPSLGPDPFLCGMTDPMCPSGYSPVQEGPRCICRRGRIDAGGFACNNDSLVTGDPGGNEDRISATITGIGPNASTALYNDMSICPSSDIDVFSLMVIVGGRSIDARVLHDTSQGMLEVSILDAGGTVLANGSADVGGVRATATAPVAAQYFVQVSSIGSIENNYDLQIQVQ